MICQYLGELLTCKMVMSLEELVWGETSIVRMLQGKTYHHEAATSQGETSMLGHEGRHHAVRQRHHGGAHCTIKW